MLREAWYAVYVRSHAERSVVRHLAEKGYEPFLPMYVERRRWADRTRDIEAPLFPGYVFCRVTSAANGLIMTTPGVVRIVGAGSVPVPIDDEEIEALRRIAASGATTEPWPFLHVGDRVEIESGPLAGVQGVLVRVANGNRLVVSVTLLQRSVSVEIDAWHVSPIARGAATAPFVPAAVGR
jgi:transcription antitermination factor NusG